MTRVSEWVGRVVVTGGNHDGCFTEVGRSGDRLVLETKVVAESAPDAIDTVLVCGIDLDIVSVNVAQAGEQDDMELVGLYEAAVILGVARQRVSELIKLNKDFPKPLARLRMGPVLRRSEVEKFLRDWDRRPGRKTRVPARP